MKPFVLKEQPWTDFKEDLFSHYAGSRGVIGRNIFYGIYSNDKKIGVTGAQGISLPMGSVAREVYKCSKITTEIRKKYFVDIANNDIFRLYENEKNLASQILSRFVKFLRRDWKRKYGVDLKGLISLTYGTNEKGSERTGQCYKAAGWKYLGMSKGIRKRMFGKSMTKGRDGKLGDLYKSGEIRAVYEKVTPKHVWLWNYLRKKGEGEAIVVQGEHAPLSSGEMAVTPTQSHHSYHTVVRGGKVRLVRD